MSLERAASRWTKESGQTPKGVPAFRNFTSNFSILLKDGQTAPGQLLMGLSPNVDLYLFVVAKDAAGKSSRPGKAFKVNLKESPTGSLFLLWAVFRSRHFAAAWVRLLIVGAGAARTA